MTNEINKETETEVVLGPMKLNPEFDLKAQLHDPNRVINVGIFDKWYVDHPEEKDNRPTRIKLQGE